MSLLLLQIGCCGKYLSRAKIELPQEPEYATMRIWPCEVVAEHKEAAIRFYLTDSYNHAMAYCITEEDLQNLLINLIKKDLYKAELIEIIKALADIEEE